MSSCPSAWARASAWRSSTGGSAIAGLAHVVLPASGGHASPSSYKFADRAVPELIERVVAAGGRRPMLDAVLVGGASMFTVSSATLEVGQRNEAAVRDQLATARIPVIAAETGGDRGRTIRVHVGHAPDHGPRGRRRRSRPCRSAMWRPRYERTGPEP